MKQSLAAKYPLFLPLFYTIKVAIRFCENRLKQLHKLKKSHSAFGFKIHEHQSPLKRKVSLYTNGLLDAKKTNLSIAIKEIDCVVIKPGETFSFWEQVGKPSYSKGYKDGLMLKNGKPVKGPGGGLCQLSNMLFWLFMHTNMEIVERHHHSYDSFPDVGRTLPFGSGASVLYNYYDLKVINKTENEYQIQLWLSETKLRGKILSNKSQDPISVIERDHKYIFKNEMVFRSNKIYRIKGETEKLMCENFAPVLYEVSKDKLILDGFVVVEN